MTTVSVPLPADLLKALEQYICQGSGRKKAEVMRRALEKYLEDEAVQAVLLASKEPRLRGDLDELAVRL